MTTRMGVRNCYYFCVGSPVSLSVLVDWIRQKMEDYMNEKDRLCKSCLLCVCVCVCVHACVRACVLGDGVLCWKQVTNYSVG